MKAGRFLLPLLLLLPLCCAASDDEQYFETTIRPLLIENCIGCHGPQKQKGGLRLDSAENLRKGSKNGPVISGDEPSKSTLLQVIRYAGEIQMPPDEKLPQTKIDALGKWVEMGAPWPAQKKIATESDAWKKHWAFQPVTFPRPSAVKEKKWAKSPVDAFVLAKIEQSGLKPSKIADRRTLIRRATIDLLGLPPSPEEVREFETDNSPDAFAKLVARLLASPHYGERWGRMWLDVARFADTKGYVYDRDETRFVHSYVYRDWVIDAFNRDMPYDDFLRMQLAADAHVKGSDNKNLAAMGFLTLGRTLLNNIHDIIDDRIDTMMRGTQALTVACARCHDHKFDPIPTEDYYSLYSILLNSTERAASLGSNPERTKDFIAYEKGLKEREEKLSRKFETKREEFNKRLREKAGDYLLAVLDADKLPSEEFYVIFDANDIIPTIVRQWQSYLFEKRKSNDTVFALWHALAKLPQKDFAARAPAAIAACSNSYLPILKAFMENPPSSMREVAERYGAFIKEARQNREKFKDNANPFIKPPSCELCDVLFAADSPCQIPSGAINEVEWFFEEGTRVELAKLQAEIERWIIRTPAAPPYAVYLADRLPLKPGRVLVRGNPKNKGNEVPRQYVHFLSGSERKPFEIGSGRAELAEAIASRKNPLTARVMVNRIWQKHFGTALVRTPSDFGLRSEPPTHPELLDYLASRFMERWSIKDMHRLIMNSSTYQQSSDDAFASEKSDPENKLYARFNRQRLDFETLRDALIFTGGDLNLKVGGPPVDLMKLLAKPRRSIYGLIDRQKLSPVLRVFDFPNPDAHSPQRYNTTVPQQALFFLNSPFVIQRAKALAKKTETINEPSARVQSLYQSLFQREATKKELKTALQFVAGANEPEDNAPARVISPDWKYGFGEFDTATKLLKNFTPLPHFTGEAWQGGDNWPDTKLGWVRLTADGGHAGNDLQHAAVRRFVAPENLTVSVACKLKHTHPEGDGIVARVVSSRTGLIQEWTLHNKSVTVDLKDIALEKGDTLDFAVDIRGTLNNDDFTFAPGITAAARKWEAAADFGGPTPKQERLTAWEKYVQVLLSSNEFVFVD